MCACDEIDKSTVSRIIVRLPFIMRKPFITIIESRGYYLWKIQDASSLVEWSGYSSLFTNYGRFKTKLHMVIE